jgi:hypothetical protein
VATPLPPRLSTDSSYPALPQLRIDAVGGLGEILCRDDVFLDLDPMRCGNFLSSERLDIFDGMAGSMFEESTNDVQPFVVGYMCSWLLVTRFAVEILLCMVQRLLAHTMENWNVRERTKLRSLLELRLLQRKPCSNAY